MIAAHLRSQAAACLVVAIVANNVMAETKPDAWPTFRGVERTGVATADGELLESWPEGGPPLIWRVAGAGRGYSSLAIAEGRIYTLGDAPSTAEDDNEYLTCFDQNDGRQLWIARTGSAWNEGQPSWQGSRSTPTVDGDRVFAMTPYGVVVCFSVRGELLWHRDLPREFAGRKADSWGYSESVLVDGERLLCTPGGPANTMVAFDKETGATLWSASRAGDRGAGHASIVTADVTGTLVYVQSTGSGAMGVRADDGKVLWTFDIPETTAVIPTPIVRDDLVFFVAGYGVGGALLRQTPTTGGDVTIEVVYPLQRELANKHGGVVLVGNYLYGDSEDRGIIYCADFLTGEVQWRSRGAGRGSAAIAAADERLYIRFEDGTLSLAKASPERLTTSGRLQIPGSGRNPSWSHPVILDGRMYLREGDLILCYDVSK